MTRSGDGTGVAGLRAAAREIFQAGVAAADPAQAVRRALRRDGTQLEILLSPGSAPGEPRRGPWRTVRPVAIGKAALAMARAVAEMLPESLFRDGGVVVTNHENLAVGDACELPGFEVIGAGHPLPDEGGMEGGRRVMEIAGRAGEGELLLVLVSGGASALVPAPVPPVTLQEKVTTTDLLLSCGADIVQINCVRKHLSALKGGGLARLAAPADLHALILSDVIGDDFSAIASGPTVPDATTFAEAVAILQTGSVWNRVPKSVKTRLERGCDGLIEETPKPDDPVFARTGATLVGSNRMSLDAVAQAASALGYETRIVSNSLCGEARDAAASLLSAALAEPTVSSRPLALLAGGETTVTLKGSGLGGRNQEMALAFAVQARARKLPGNWVFLSGGTDGRDGPTDAAGGIVDPASLARITASGGDPEGFLTNNDSYHALDLAGDLLKPGATGTNVADLQILLMESDKA